MQEYDKILPTLSGYGATIVAISPMIPEFSMELHRELSLSFDILSDKGNSFASSLGLTFTIADEVREVYKGAGLQIPEYNGDRSWKLPITATFIVDISGTVVLAWKETDHTRRLEPREIVETLQCMVTAL